MKRITLILMLFSAFLVVKAQEESPTSKGNTLLNVNTGIFGGSGGVNLIPIQFGMDFFVVDNLSAGFDLGWRYFITQDTVGKPSLISVQAVVDYHFNQVMNLSDPWDFYAGVKLGTGYMTTNKDEEVFNLSYSNGFKFVFDGRAGIRYYFNTNLAINSEIGVTSVSGTNTTNATFVVGITAKL